MHSPKPASSLFRFFTLRHPSSGRLSASVLAAIIGGLIVFGSVALGPNNRAWQDLFFDSVWRLSASEAPDDRVVVIDIDETSLRQLGPWPWPREQIAQLVSNIRHMGASIVILDLVLPDARTGDSSVKRQILEGGVVFGQIFADPSQTLSFSNAGLLSAYSSTEVQDCPAFLVRAGSFLANDQALGVQMAGHISPAVDMDGVVRRFPAVVCFEDILYPALSLAGMSALVGTQSGWQIETPGNRPSSAASFNNQGGLYSAIRAMFPPRAWLANEDIPGMRVPVEDNGLTRISYSRMRSAYSAVSASEILQAPTKKFDGAIVIVGATAFGVSDSVPTPLSGLSSGVEIHLQVLSSMLDDRLVYMPVHEPLFAFAFWALASLIFWVVISFIPGLSSVRPTFLLLLGPIVAGLLLFLQVFVFLVGSIWVFNLPALLYPFMLSILFLGYFQWQAGRERNRAIAHLESFAGPGALTAFASSTLSRRDAIALRTRGADFGTLGEKDSSMLASELVAVFVDLKGFSKYSIGKKSQDIAAVIDEFYSITDEVVTQYEGHIDHFAGDGVLAIFLSKGQTTTPTDYRYVDSAVAAAFALHEKLLQSQFFSQASELSPRIGLDFGEAMLGIFGRGARRAYTVFGDAVNRASRLEELTRSLDCDLIVGEALFEKISSESLRTRLHFLGRHQLRGISDSVSLYGFRKPR